MRALSLAVAAAIAAFAGGAGCASSQDDAVTSTARDFYDALGAGDTGAACALLAPTTRSELETSSGRPCPEALAEEEIPPASDPSDVAAFGTMARVRLDGDTAFLTRFQDGWAVLSAGCTPREGTYDCVVKGG